MTTGLKKHPTKTPKKSRRVRNDSRQKRPVFSELTQSVGFQAPETIATWKAQKIRSGRFLHPALVRMIERIQRDYRHCVLRHPCQPERFLGISPPNPEIGRMQQIEAKSGRSEPLDEEEQRLLDVWRSMQSESAKHTSNLSQAVVAAAACGDIAFFKHLALVIESLQTSGKKTALSLGRAIDKAYEAIVSRRLSQAFKDQEPGSQGLSAMLGPVRRRAELLKKIELPDVNDIDQEIFEDPEMRGYVGEWENTEASSRHRHREGLF